MKLTRKQIVDVHNALSKFEGKAMSLRCGFALNKAKQAIAGEITALVEAQGKLRLTPELEEYNKAISELDRSDVEKYNEEAKAIYEQHKEAVEEFRKKDAEFGELLKEEVEVDIKPIPSSILPDDVLTLAEIEAIMPVLTED